MKASGREGSRLTNRTLQLLVASSVVVAWLVVFFWISGGFAASPHAIAVSTPSVPALLPLGARLSAGLHVTARDQRLAERLGLTVSRALKCQSASSVGTRGWSADAWAAAVGAAAAYRARHATLIANLSTLSPRNPTDWFDSMPPLHACGGRDADAPPHDAALMRYAGDGDGGKWLCSIAELTPPCLVYSLGSWGDFKFEEAMSAATACDVWSFDCTVPPERMPASLPPRVHFDATCVGTDGADAKYQSLSTIMARLGHGAIHLLKMDIEGWEFKVLKSLADAARADRAAAASFLPFQMSFEVHLHHLDADPAKRATGLVDVFQDLLDLHYVPVSRELNLLCPHCEEFVFIKLADECFANTA
jgi:hypothetical protein